MSGDVLTRWGLVLLWERPEADDQHNPTTTEDVFAHARSAYLDRCPVLAAFLDAEAAEIRVADGPAGPAIPGWVLPADDALVGVSVVEVRPTSFDMAVRIRPTGSEDSEDGAAEPVNMRRTLVVERTATGERLAIPREVRDEFIALQLSARDFC